MLSWILGESYFENTPGRVPVAVQLYDVSFVAFTCLGSGIFLVASSGAFLPSYCMCVVTIRLACSPIRYFVIFATNQMDYLNLGLGLLTLNYCVSC